MINIKTKIYGENENNCFIEIEKHIEKNTNTIEHIAIIDIMAKEILENDKSITKKDLLNIISKNMNKKS